MNTPLAFGALETRIVRAVKMCLGIDPDDPVHQSRVRVSWPSSDGGNGDWERDEDVIFLRVTPDSDPYAVPRESAVRWDAESEKYVETVTYHRAYRAQIIFYGPNAADDADAVRVGLFRESVKRYLREAGLAPVPSVPEPVRVPETDESGQWWERCDLSVPFYGFVARTYEAEAVETPPAVHAHLYEAPHDNPLTDEALRRLSDEAQSLLVEETGGHKHTEY